MHDLAIRLNSLSPSEKSCLKPWSLLTCDSCKVKRDHGFLHHEQYMMLYFMQLQIVMNSRWLLLTCDRCKVKRDRDLLNHVGRLLLRSLSLVSCSLFLSLPLFLLSICCVSHVTCIDKCILFYFSGSNSLIWGKTRKPVRSKK